MSVAWYYFDKTAVKEDIELEEIRITQE